MAFKSSSALIIGILLIALGALFLLANLTLFSISWTFVLKIVLPALLVLFGIVKLFRHYFWNEEQIIERPGRAGLLSGLFWLSLGSVILLDVFGIVETLSFIGLYWPVLLIVFGLGKIADYYRMKGRIQVRTAEVFGVAFVITFGLASSQLAKAHFPLLDDFQVEWPWPHVNLEGDKFRFTTESEADLEGIATIEIENLYGDVEITSPSTENNAQIALLKVVLAESLETAEDLAKEVSIVEVRDGTTLRIRTNRIDLGERGRKLSTHLTISASDTIPVKVRNSYGDVRLSDRAASCFVDNSYGDVVVGSVTADVEVKNKYESVTIDNVKGAVRVENRRGSISVMDITGDVDLKTDHSSLRAERIQGNVAVNNLYGQIRLEEVSGSAHIEAGGSQVTVRQIDQLVSLKTSHKRVVIEALGDRLDMEAAYCSVKLSQIDGFVDLKAAQTDVRAEEIRSGLKFQGRGSKVVLEQIEGDLEIATSLKPVSVTTFSGPVSIQNEFGSISLENDREIKTPISANNKNGEIFLTLPATANFNLSAQAVEGDIVSDFGPDPEESQGSIAHLEASIGKGGPQIELQTTHSRIRIKKRG